MSDIISTLNKVQVEGARYRSPVGESLVQAFGSAINGLIDVLVPVGTVVDSVLTEAQFQTEVGLTTTWILADGRNIAGSKLATVTGNVTAPDLRGVFRRGKNNGRASGTGNSNGEVAIETYQADKHDHFHKAIDFVGLSNADRYVDSAGNLVDLAGSVRGAVEHFQTSAGATPGIDEDVYTHGNIAIPSVNSEVHVRNVTVNVFIRIN